MKSFLTALQNRRAAVQASIDDEQRRPSPDPVRLMTLKKLRLHFRDQIEFIERLNRQGQASLIPVVRRRTRLTLQGKS